MLASVCVKGRSESFYLQECVLLTKVCFVFSKEVCFWLEGVFFVAVTVVVGQRVCSLQDFMFLARLWSVEDWSVYSW